MAKGRGSRGPTRMDLRRQNEAAEAKDGEVKAVDAEAEEDEEPEAEVEAEADAEEGDDDEEGGKKKKKKAVKKKAAPKVKKPAAKRTRTPKEVKQRAIWVVFDNASKRVDTFPYNQKADAEALLAKKILEKEGKATFYMNLVKEEMT